MRFSKRKKKKKNVFNNSISGSQRLPEEGKGGGCYLSRICVHGESKTVGGSNKREVEGANASPFINGRRHWFSAGYRTPESTSFGMHTVTTREVASRNINKAGEIKERLIAFRV